MWPNLFDGRSCSFQTENRLEFLLLLIFSVLHLCQLFLPFTYIFLVTSKWMSGNIPQKKKMTRPFQVLQEKKKKICVKTESPASTGPPSSLFTGSQTDENSLQVMPNTGIQLENFDALILDICDYARAARNTPHVHA